MKSLSLRWKLAAHTAVLASLVLMIFGIGVSWHLYNEGIHDLDAGLREVSRGFFAEIDRRHGSVDWTDRADVDSLFPAVTTLYRIEIMDHGRVVYRSRNLGTQEFPALSGRQAFATSESPFGRLRVAETERKDLSLRLATGILGVEETRKDLLEFFLIAAPVVLLLVGVGARVIAGRALAPVDEIAATAQRITAQRLDLRLPLPGTKGDEMDRLTRVLNQMIDRLERSFLQATRFTADASHELKTPLTIIRGEIEAELRTSGHGETQEKLLLNLLEETTRLVSITDDLLLLSRADAGKLELETTPIDLSLLLADMIEDAEILAEREALTIRTEIPPGVQIQANDHFLRQLLQNLFENAIKYNHAGGQLRIRVIPGRTSHEFAIANTGSGLTAEQATRVFNRFYRADTSRDHGIGGHGLGLSICREIARALGGEIGVRTEEQGWTEFRVTLPAARIERAHETLTMPGVPETTSLSSTRR